MAGQCNKGTIYILPWNVQFSHDACTVSDHWESVIFLLNSASLAHLILLVTLMLVSTIEHLETAAYVASVIGSSAEILVSHSLSCFGG